MRINIGSENKFPVNILYAGLKLYQNKLGSRWWLVMKWGTTRFHKFSNIHTNGKTLIKWMKMAKNGQNGSNGCIYLKNCLNMLLIAFCCALVIDPFFSASSVELVIVSKGPVFVVFDISGLVITWILKLTSTLFSPLLLGETL